MNLNSLLRVFIVIMIIIGVLIIFIGKPILPEPPCIACGSNLVNLAGIAEMILGVAALVVQGKIANMSHG